jgi:HEAT repeat protein
LIEATEKTMHNQTGIATTKAKANINRRARVVVLPLIALTIIMGVMLSGIKFIKASAESQDLRKLNRFVEQQTASGASAKVFREGRDLIGDENWTGAAEKFRGFVVKYPRDPNVDAALYWLAFALKKQESYAEADQQLRRLLKDFPRSKWSDDARAMQLEIDGYLGKSDKADKVLSKDKAKDKQKESNDDDEIRIVALQSLCQSNAERCMAYVSNMHKPGASYSHQMKEAGIEMIRRYGGERAVPMLIEIIRNQSDSELRKSAIHTLGRTGDERAFEILVEMVRTGTDDEVSKAAIFAISRFEGERARTMLFEMARGAKSIEIRKEAIFWLSRGGDDAVLDELMRLFQAERDVEVRKQIVFALKRMNTTRSLAKLYEIASSGSDIEVRKDALHWIGQRGDAQAVDYLIRTYDAEANEDVKNQIIFALSRTSQKSALRKLMEIARNDKSVELRKQAVFWLGRSDDPEAAKFLEDILN